MIIFRHKHFSFCPWWWLVASLPALTSCARLGLGQSFLNIFVQNSFFAQIGVNLICLPKRAFTFFALVRSEGTQATIGAQSGAREDRSLIITSDFFTFSHEKTLNSHHII